MAGWVVVFIGDFKQGKAGQDRSKRGRRKETLKLINIRHHRTEHSTAQHSTDNNTVHLVAY